MVHHDVAINICQALSDGALRRRRRRVPGAPRARRALRVGGVVRSRGTRQPDHSFLGGAWALAPWLLADSAQVYPWMRRVCTSTL